MTITSSFTLQEIQAKIYRLPNRPKPFMLSQDLAEIYEVETKYVISGVNRNPNRFPEDFYFQLADEELALSKCQKCTLHLSQVITRGLVSEV